MPPGSPGWHTVLQYEESIKACLPLFARSRSAAPRVGRPCMTMPPTRVPAERGPPHPRRPVRPERRCCTTWNLEPLAPPSGTVWWSLVPSAMQGVRPHGTSGRPTSSVLTAHRRGPPDRLVRADLARRLLPKPGTWLVDSPDSCACPVQPGSWICLLMIFHYHLRSTKTPESL